MAETDGYNGAYTGQQIDEAIAKAQKAITTDGGTINETLKIGSEGKTGSIVLLGPKGFSSTDLNELVLSAIEASRTLDGSSGDVFFTGNRDSLGVSCFVKFNGNKSGAAIDCGGRIISGVGYPDTSGAAANKGYVDSAITELKNELNETTEFNSIAIIGQGIPGYEIPKYKISSTKNGRRTEAGLGFYSNTVGFDFSSFVSFTGDLDGAAIDCCGKIISGVGDPDDGYAAANKRYVDNAVAAISGGGGPPTGSIFWMASQTIPDGYLLCDGSAVSRTDYAALFAAIGTTFGTGDGSTTFALPDLRAAFIRGAGSNNGYSATFGSKQEATFVRVVNDGMGLPRSNNPLVGNSDKAISGGYTTIQAGQFGSSNAFVEHYVRPYNLPLTPIIKY